MFMVLLTTAGPLAARIVRYHPCEWWECHGLVLRVLRSRCFTADVALFADETMELNVEVLDCMLKTMMPPPATDVNVDFIWLPLATAILVSPAVMCYSFFPAGSPLLCSRLPRSPPTSCRLPLSVPFSVLTAWTYWQTSACWKPAAMDIPAMFPTAFMAFAMPLRLSLSLPSMCLPVLPPAESRCQRDTDQGCTAVATVPIVVTVVPNVVPIVVKAVFIWVTAALTRLGSPPSVLNSFSFAIAVSIPWCRGRLPCWFVKILTVIPRPYQAQMS
jgi:hypothetical protein